MKHIWNSLLFFFAITTLFSCSNTKNWTLKSPNGNLEVVVKITDDSQLTYSVNYRNNKSTQTAIEKSLLGIEREDADFSTLEFTGIEREMNIQDSYTLITGKQLKNSSEYNGFQLSFKNPQGNKLDIYFRAYNEGIAFSYGFPEEDSKHHRVTKELSSFNLGEGFAWMHAYDTVSVWTPGYETYYELKIPIGTTAPAIKNGWAFPMLFESNGLWILVSEAGFDGSYGASHIEPDCSHGKYSIRFAEETEAHGYFENTQYNTLPWRTPWRYIIVSDNLAEIVESNLVTHLAKPNQLEDISWIQAGRASWSWWSINDSPQDYKLLVPFVDMAADMGWEYSLIDANWDLMKNGNVKKLVDYANKKGVGLLLWYNSGGKHNVVPERPRDLMDDRIVRRAEFKRIHDLGIKGIKVDFFQSDKQPVINQYIEILEDAADYELLVNFHGCTLPKGWRRTYPNLLSMEAIRGAECYIFAKEYPVRGPSHIATIPFLRNVVGPTDYTPGGFSDNNLPHLTSYGFELALPVLIESGITHIAERPSALYSLPGYIIDFFKELPVVWDETKYLSGYPGEDAVLARRSGERWYIGGINASIDPKDFNLDLSSLNCSGKTYRLIADGEDNKSFALKEGMLETESISVHSLGLGGFVCVIE